MDNLKANKIIAVDFDGTLCENKYPEIGEPRRNVIDYVKTRREHGDKIILWTCRVGEMLENAVKWCAERGLKFDAVNANLPEVIESFGGDTRKIFANEYIDDRNYPCRIDTVTNVLYVCDGKKCGDICPDKDKTCRHTSDITHAKNFTEGDYGYYWETDATAENDSDVLRQILNTVHGRDSAEFLGKLVDVVEDWLAYKGITADDVPNEERTDAENEAIICGEDYDLLAEGFRTVIHSGLIPKTEEKCEKSSMESWAEREVHKIAEKEFEWSDFSTEHLFNFGMWGEPFTDADAVYAPAKTMKCVISALNGARDRYLDYKSRGKGWEPLAKQAWWNMIQLLPSSYNQKRTVMLNYEVLAGIYPMRKNHKLDEWREFCQWIEQLPYSEIITGGDVE